MFINPKDGITINLTDDGHQPTKPHTIINGLCTTNSPKLKAPIDSISTQHHSNSPSNFRKRIRNLNSSHLMQTYSQKAAAPEVNFKYEEFVNRITCHGLQDWYASQSKPTFLFWGAVFCIATAITIHSVYTCFLEFYVNPISTSISVTPYDSLPFPDVYICPTNFINQSAFYLYLNTEAQERANIFKRESEKSEGLLGAKKVLTDAIHVADSGFPSPIFSPAPPPKLFMQQEELFSASLDVKQFIPECKFSGQTTRDKNGNKRSLDCRPWIQQTMDKDHGVCYLVKLSGTVRQHAPTKGLSLVIDLLSEDAPSEPNIASGIFVSVHSTYHPISYKRILVSPGTFTQLSLAAKEEAYVSVSTFSQTPQLCNAEGDLELSVLNVSYSREACQFDCIQQLVFANSSCLLPVDVQFIREEYLNITDWCSETQMLHYIQKEDFEKCSKNCHRACQASSFTMTTSSQKIPALNWGNTNPYNPNLYETFSAEEKAEKRLQDLHRWSWNVIILDVSFDSLEVTSVTQSKAMTVNTLLSNLGGAFGLWLGASLFTVLQFAVFLFKLCVSVCCPGKEQCQKNEI